MTAGAHERISIVHPAIENGIQCFDRRASRKLGNVVAIAPQIGAFARIAATALTEGPHFGDVLRRVMA